MTVNTRTVRRVRLAVNGFEVWVAAIAVVSAALQILGLTSVAGRTVQVVSEDVARVYSALYGLGGAVTLVGLWRGSPRLEGAGLVLIISGVLVSATALLAVLGSQGIVSAILQGGAAVACAVRIRYLSRGLV